MKMKVEYSQIVKRKMKALKNHLTEQFGSETAVKGMKMITKTARKLADFPQMGEAVSELFEVDTDFRCLYINHNYLFYYIEDDRIIIADMFGEREDFMFKLFGISSESKESADYWKE